MGSSSLITLEDVLESLMNDGTIDALKLKIINQLKANEELKNTTIKMAKQSKVLTCLVRRNRPKENCLMHLGRNLTHGDNFAAKRMRKLTQRRVVDYTSIVVRYMHVIFSCLVVFISVFSISFYKLLHGLGESD
uniref:Uncharacterized protein n=1 Tax=Gossypium raimondii TaxID=29730 RepID=A0A0D2R8R0_GOSRA|nr:hypothetical protein B456_004G218500 [Gossypium raimondii]